MSISGYDYKAKHWLCIFFGFWIDYPVSIQTMCHHNTDGETTQEKIMVTYWELSWKPPLLPEKYRFALMRIPTYRNQVKSKRDEIQALFDTTDIIEIDIS